MNFQRNTALEYIALGDSLTVGVGVPLFDPGFVEVYARNVERDIGKRVQIYKYAKVGATTGDVVNLLTSNCVQAAIKQADIITITAGGNDLIKAARIYIQNQDKEVLDAALATSINNLTELIRSLDLLIEECEGPFIIRLANLYNPFPSIPLVDPWVQTFNQHVQGFSSIPNVKIADIYSVFKGCENDLLSSDKIHPNGKGYFEIARSFREFGYKPLTSRDE
ncbi:GDSL-type esterase/lipase family protein [Bacillus sp. DJP31]|uniref:GDSL-type esterase/lipase family protein n=1 Tax=Bacillus sp. DJP31 TaxID=3409789 RepID=UPI003BB789C2